MNYPDAIISVPRYDLEQWTLEPLSEVHKPVYDVMFDGNPVTSTTSTTWGSEIKVNSTAEPVSPAFPEYPFATLAGILIL